MPLGRLSVYVDGDRVVAWDGATRWQPDSGQFLFNFSAGAVLRRAGRVAQLPKQEAKKPSLESQLSALQSKFKVR